MVIRRGTKKIRMLKFTFKSIYITCKTYVGGQTVHYLESKYE